MVLKIDLNNLMKFLKLRLHPHAQLEARIYAQAMYDLAKQFFPITMKAFDDYVLGGCNFSREEKDIISTLVDVLNKTTIGRTKIDQLLAESSLSKREITEFKHKIKLEDK